MTSIFSPEALAKIVNDTIPASVPGEQHNFVLVGGVNQEGAQVVARFEKQQHGWVFDADAVWKYDWTGNSTVGAQVLLKW